MIVIADVTVCYGEVGTLLLWVYLDFRHRKNGIFLFHLFQLCSDKRKINSELTQSVELTASPGNESSNSYL